MIIDPVLLLAQIAWETMVKNVRMLTDWTYCITVSPENLNDVGAGIKEVGFYFIDNNGNQYSVTAINVNGVETDIEVTDDFKCGSGPVTDRTGIVYEAVGDSRYLAQVMYSRLDSTAQDKGRAIDLAVLWDSIKRNFIELLDVPSSLVGQALKSLRVNATETEIEFALIDTSKAFTELTDVIDNNYIGKALNVPLVNITETDLELTETKEAEFTDSSDVPSSYVGSEGYVVRVNSAGTRLEFVSLSGSDITTRLGFTPENIANKVISITGLSTDSQYPTAKLLFDKLALKLDVNLKGSVNGLAELDANGFVKNTQLPSYVDDVLEYANFASLPVMGESGKIYVTIDTNLTYRWSGSTYTEISASLALGETSATAYRGDRGKVAYDHSQTAHAAVITGLTSNYIPKWNGSALINSLFSDDGVSGTCYGPLVASLFGASSFAAYGSTSGYATIVATPIAGTPILTLPTVSGIFALMSNLDNYLPLIGGTLTGVLNGASATFSGSVTATQGFITGTSNLLNLKNISISGYCTTDYFNSDNAQVASFGYGNASVAAVEVQNAAYIYSGAGVDFVALIGGSERLRIASTGAATFSGSVTAPNLPIAGSFSQTVTAVTAFVVTIGQTMANTTYKVCVTPTDMLAAAVFYVTSKSTTQFTVTYLTGLTGVVTFDWIIVP